MDIARAIYKTYIWKNSPRKEDLEMEVLNLKCHEILNSTFEKNYSDYSIRPREAKQIIQYAISLTKDKASYLNDEIETSEARRRVWLDDYERKNKIKADNSLSEEEKELKINSISFGKPKVYYGVPEGIPTQKEIEENLSLFKENYSVLEKFKRSVGKDEPKIIILNKS